MTRNKALALRLAAIFALCGLAFGSFVPGAAAQDAPSQKIIKDHYVVVSMSPQLLQVHSATNERDLHTFSYAPDLRPQIVAILNAGGYQYGDKVTIWHKSGEDVAVKIKGKPSKPK
jgi:hypothetical protein